jgi:alkyl sulfatase BDS1-like metallo-beta-lactamase superfamily hydrolase
MTTATVPYLSPEFLAELERLAVAGPVIPQVNIRLQFRVVDAPEPESGEFDYYFRVERGVITQARRGRIEEPELTITAAYADLVEFQAGDLHAATAFMTGHFRVAGDKAKLLELMLILQSGSYHRISADLWERTQP